MNQFFSAAEIALRLIARRRRMWWASLQKARAYSPRHRYRKSRPVVTLDTPDAERTARYAPVPAADPWLEYMTAQRQNAYMIMNSQEGPLRRVNPTASLVGRNPYPASEEPSTAEFMRTVESWGNPDRRHRSDNRRRLQRTAARISPWTSAL